VAKNNNVTYGDKRRRQQELLRPSMISSGFRVLCARGFDGGLPQTFLLEIYAGEELKSKVRLKHFFEHKTSLFSFSR